MASNARPRASKAFLEPTISSPSFCVGAARCIDVARLELVRLYNEATVARRSEHDGWEQIQLSLRELARQCADLRPDLVRRFSNDGLLASNTEKAHIDLPLDVFGMRHVEDAHDDRTPQGLLAPAVAERLDAIGAELAAMNAAASGAERREVGEPICSRLRELYLQYAHAPQGADNEPSQRSHADAIVGTDDFEVDAACGRLVRRRILDSGIESSMVVELAPSHGPRTFDVQDDLARMVCGRSAAALAIRLRWVCIAIGILGAALPILVIFVVHWASGGPGQFALAYEWPLWLEVWMCVGWWLAVCVLLLWFASMQREIAWMALKQVSTLWVIAMTGALVAGLVSLWEFGVHRSTWVVLPVYVGNSLCFPLVAMADALPPKLRLGILRFLGPLALGAVATVALVLRLPTAEDTPGELVWTVMGTDTVTNLEALTYSATVLALLLAKGVVKSWVFPNRLAFIETSLNIAERVSNLDIAERVSNAAAVQGPHAVPATTTAMVAYD
jgi:hypothetical protein